MTNITTGNINERVSRSRFKDVKEEQCDSQFKMDTYNAGLIFGSLKELAATRVNQQYQRKLLIDWKNLESERNQTLRELRSTQSTVEARSEQLNKLRRQFTTNLEPVHYNKLMLLYHQGKLKPQKFENIRINSAKMIREKARQLNIISLDNRHSANNIRSSRSVSSRVSRYTSIRKPVPTIEITPMKTSHSDNLEVDINGNLVRIIETDGWKKIVPLIHENSIPNAVNIKHSETLSKAAIQQITEQIKSETIQHLNINFQALGADFLTVSRTPDKRESTVNFSPIRSTNLRSQAKPKYRSLSAHPKLRVPSSQTQIYKESQSDEKITEKIELFCRSISAFK